MKTDKELIEPAKAVEFLTEAATYFARRPTGGEDAAHWSNAANAATCRRIAALITSELLSNPQELPSRLEALSSGEAVEPTDAMLRAYYETKCAQNASPAGGFSRWATWEEIVELPGAVDEMRMCLRAALALAPALSTPMPRREEVERSLAAKLEEVGGAYLSIDQAVDALFSSSLGGEGEEEGSPSRSRPGVSAVQLPASTADQHSDGGR